MARHLRNRRNTHKPSPYTQKMQERQHAAQPATPRTFQEKISVFERASEPISQQADDLPPPQVVQVRQLSGQATRPHRSSPLIRCAVEGAAPALTPPTTQQAPLPIHHHTPIVELSAVQCILPAEEEGEGGPPSSPDTPATDDESPIRRDLRRHHKISSKTGQTLLARLKGVTTGGGSVVQQEMDRLEEEVRHAFGCLWSIVNGIFGYI